MIYIKVFNLICLIVFSLMAIRADVEIVFGVRGTDMEIDAPKLSKFIKVLIIAMAATSIIFQFMDILK